MVEITCAKCGKVCMYLVKGSKVANGTIALCYKCKSKPKETSSDMPEFLRGLFK